MDKHISEKLHRLQKLTDTDDPAEANRAKLFFVAPTLEALRDRKMNLSEVDDATNQIISELYKKAESGELTIRQSMLFEKLTGQ